MVNTQNDLAVSFLREERHVTAHSENLRPKNMASAEQWVDEQSDCVPTA